MNPGITSVAAKDGVDGFENRNVDDGHGATGAARSKLLAKGADFARRKRGVIESAGINRDRVPAVNGVERIFWREAGASRLDAIEARAKEISKTGRVRAVAET